MSPTTTGNPEVALAAAGGPLLTPAQLAAEQLAIEVATAPELATAVAELRSDLLDTPEARTPDGLALLDRALDHWVRSLALRHAASDPVDPAFIWSVDETPRRTGEHHWPGAGIGGVGNPDNVYRNAFVDGALTYEILGRRAANGSAHFSVEVTPQEPGRFELIPVEGNEADLGAQLGILTISDVPIAPDGTFRVTIGPDRASDGRSHIQTRPGPLGVTHRDTLTAWSQTPNEVQIRRTSDAAVAGDRPDPATGPDLATLVARTVASLPGYVGFWGAFRGFFLGVPEPNRVVAPVEREGGWGLASGGRFRLADDEVLLVTTALTDAAYTGFQIADPWMMVDDPRNRQLSLNGDQVAVEPDGTITYAIAPRDPGLANWLDTGASRHGWFMLRWQWAGPRSDTPDLIRGARVVARDDLARHVPEGVAWQTPDERAARRRERQAAYDARLAVRTA